MKLSARSKKVGAVGAFALLGMLSYAVAGKWTPYQFGEQESYDFKVTTHDGDTPKTGYFGIAVKPSDQKGPNGEEQVEVTYTSRGTMAKSDLGPQTAWGMWGSMNLGMLAMNPMYSTFFGQLDMKVGEKMSLFGQGILKVTGKETIAKREGFVCQLYMNQDGKDVLTAEWTVDPALALPLRSKTYEDGKVQAEMELVKYTGKK